MADVQTKIREMIEKHRVVLFMKGSKMMPACGFSASVVEVLNSLGADYETVNVLADPEIRQGIKDFSSWPTIPQLYVDGKFVGGADIVRDMNAKGELAPLIRGQASTH